MQRVGICRAIINEPEIIFADEPTGALDSKSSIDVLTLFQKLNSKNKTILMVTHDINVASKAERVLFMKDGLLYKDIKLDKNSDENLLSLQVALSYI